jgi:hypothetical protein
MLAASKEIELKVRNSKKSIGTRAAYLGSVIIRLLDRMQLYAMSNVRDIRALPFIRGGGGKIDTVDPSIFHFPFRPPLSVQFRRSFSTDSSTLCILELGGHFLFSFSSFSLLPLSQVQTNR